MYYSNASLKRMNDRRGKPWRGTLQYKDEQGKWRQKTRVFSGVRYKRDALIALERWRAEMEAEAQHQATGIAMEPSADQPPTVEQAIRSHLSFQMKLGILSLGTYQKQVAQAERGIFPLIGMCEFEKLTGEDMERYIDFLSSTMKPRTVRNFYSIVNKTYRDAIRRGLVKENPCAFVCLPRAERTPINYLDAEGRLRFLEEISKLPEANVLRIAATLAFFTGMRASEICALRWQDVNLPAKTLHVAGAARRVKGPDGENLVVVGPTKTTAGKRTIPLLPHAEQMLTDLARMERRSLARSAFVLGDANDPTLLCGNFLAWSKRCGINGKAGKPVTMHGLRHTFATIGVQSGMDVKSLASILGHARADMTLNVYASSDEEAKRVAMRNLGALLEEQGLRP